MSILIDRRPSWACENFACGNHKWTECNKCLEGFESTFEDTELQQVCLDEECE